MSSSAAARSARTRRMGREIHRAVLWRALAMLAPPNCSMKPTPLAPLAAALRLAPLRRSPIGRGPQLGGSGLSRAPLAAKGCCGSKWLPTDSHADPLTVGDNYGHYS